MQGRWNPALGVGMGVPEWPLARRVLVSPRVPYCDISTRGEAALPQRRQRGAYLKVLEQLKEYS